jgi:cell division protein FtsB
MAGYGLIVASLLLVVNAVVGENGYLDTLRTRREYDELSNTLRRTREENHRMKEQILRLQHDPGALEEAARERLHMALPGETVFLIKDAIKDAPNAPKTAPPAR